MNIRISDRLFWGLAVGGEIIDQLVGGGSRAYHAGKLFFWTPVGYSRRRYRDIASRLVRTSKIQKVIINGQVQFRLASAGRQQLLRAFPVLKQTGKPWDGFWRLVVFDIPETRRSRRDSLRRELVKLGFGRLQDSIYLSPHAWDETFLNWIKSEDLSGAILLLEAKQKHLGEPRQLAEKVWQLTPLARSYRQLIDRLTTRFGIKDVRKRDEFLRRSYHEYLEIALTDPWLPQELLPDDWPAGKCRRFLLRAGTVSEPVEGVK